MFFKISFIIIITFVYQQKVLSIKFNPNKRQSDLIEMSIDSSVNPCEDFYAYACNNYKEQHMGSSYKEIIGEMDYKMNVKLINLLETSYQTDYNVPDRCQTFVEKARIYYKSCLRENVRNITKYFDELKPGDDTDWPILQEVKRFQSHKQLSLYKWPDNKNFDFFDLAGKLHSYGLNNLLVYHNITQQQNGSLSIQIEPVYFVDTTSLPDLRIIQVLLMGLGVKLQNLEVYIKQLQNTDQQLFDLQSNYTQTDDVNEVEFSYLSQLYPNLNLTAYLRHLIPLTIENNTKIVLKYSEYFQYLNDEPWLRLEKTHLCNYFMLKFLHYLAVDSTSGFSKLDCIKDLRNKMDLVLNYLHYNHNYQFKARTYNYEIETMQQYIKTTMSNYFNENHLNLTKKQVETLQQKLMNMQTNIGNLPNNVSIDDIEEFYGAVEPLDKTNYYKNHLLLLRHRFVKSKLTYPQNQSHFIASDNHFGSSSAPIYVNRQNMIILPFGSLQFPLFHSDYHDLYKLSLLGFILAHEFTHGFDTEGLNFDIHGLPLASPSSVLDNQNFISSLQCMHEQEDTVAIDERIADLFAIRIVYKMFVDNSYNLQPLFSSVDWKRLFFLNLAQFFCGKRNIKFIDHDNDSTRLKQILMNFNRFSETFHCPLGSKMNPVTKCRLY